MRQLAFVGPELKVSLSDMNLSFRKVRLAVFAREAPDVVRMSVAQRHHVDRCGVNTRAPEIGEQAAAARAVHLAKPDTCIDQDEFLAGIDDERILLDQEIIVQEIGSE